VKHVFPTSFRVISVVLFINLTDRIFKVHTISRNNFWYNSNTWCSEFVFCFLLSEELQIWPSMPLVDTNYFNPYIHMLFMAYKAGGEGEEADFTPLKIGGEKSEGFQIFSNLFPSQYNLDKNKGIT
jgi:hypothetical protein